MKRVIHLSDIHFGRERPELVTPLVERIEALAPDLVVISGDLTQRARNHQFRDARAFIDRLTAPVLPIPGNHDVPLDNLYARLVKPWRRYRRWISTDLEPVFRDDSMVVVGLNSVNPLNWQRGRFRGAARVRRAFDEAGERMRVVTLHHPLHHPVGSTKALTRGAAAGLRTLADQDVDVVLTGHLHLWSSDLFPPADLARDMVQVRVGTALSTRQRGEENDFNLLTLSPGQIRVDRFATDDTGVVFTPERTSLFSRVDTGWHRIGAA